MSERVTFEAWARGIEVNGEMILAGDRLPMVDMFNTYISAWMRCVKWGLVGAKPVRVRVTVEVLEPAE